MARRRHFGAVDQRPFLLSLLATAACGSAFADNDAQDWGVDRLPGRGFDAECRAAVELYAACEDAEYGSTGSLSPDEYADYICDYEGMLASSYGDRCREALADHYACLSRLDCGAFSQGLWPPDCNDARVAGSAQCPELLPLCDEGSLSGCGFERSRCADGNTYAADCEDDGGCVCFINGAAIATASIPADAECGWERPHEAAAACGFPPGV